MKPEAQRIAIAKVCGWKNFIQLKLPVYGAWGNYFPASHAMTPVATPPQIIKNHPTFFGSNDIVRQIIPDYLNDLNAMYEAEKTLTACLLDEMNHNLHAMYPCLHIWRATAPQRAEAFLRTLNLWTP